MAGEVTPHLAFPLRFGGRQFVTVEEGSARHLQDQADVLVRTTPGTMEATPELGLRELVGRLGLSAPAVLDALADHVDTRFLAAEDEADLLTRVRNVTLELEQPDAS